MSEWKRGDRVTTPDSEGDVGIVEGFTHDGFVRVSWPIPGWDQRDTIEVDPDELQPADRKGENE